MPADTLLQRLFLDAQEEFVKAIDHVPNPGRGGAIGSLNPASWTVAHLASTHDAWINVFCAEDDPEPWIDAWYEANGDRNAPPTDDTLPAYDDVRASFERVAENAARWVEHASWEELLSPAALPPEAGAWAGTRRAYLVARAIAHIYIHAGELSVLASLMAADDLGLPGDLQHSSPPTAEDDPSVPVIAALLRDAFVEMRRIAVVTPTPAVEGAMDRLNPVSHTVVHVLQREDRFWSQVAQGNEPNAALAELAEGASAEPKPLPWGDCLDALDGVEWAVSPWLGTVTPQVGATPMKWRDDSSYAAQMARSATHLLAHAGEIQAHASLYGVQSIGQPGPLARVSEVLAGMPS